MTPLALAIMACFSLFQTPKLQDKCEKIWLQNCKAGSLVQECSTKAANETKSMLTKRD